MKYIMENMKKVIKETLKGVKAHSRKVFYMALTGVDYKMLSDSVLKIGKLQRVDDIVEEAAKGINEILDCRVFGFAIKSGNAREVCLHTVDVWVEPKDYEDYMVEVVKNDFKCQHFVYNIHYVNRGRCAHTPACAEAYDRKCSYKDVSKGAEAHLHVRRRTSMLLRFTLVDGINIAKLYIMPNRKIMYHHIDIMNILVRSISIALKSALNVSAIDGQQTIDRLTECYSQSAFDSHIEHDIYIAKRYGSGLSLIVLNVDNLQAVVDAYGKEAGDLVLRAVAQNILSAVRKGDYVARYGETGFVVALPETRIISAEELGIALCRLIATKTVEIGSERSKCVGAPPSKCVGAPPSKMSRRTSLVTCSFNVATLRGGDTKDTLLACLGRRLQGTKNLENKSLMPPHKSS